MAKRALISVLGIIFGAVSVTALAGGVTVTKPDNISAWAEGSKHRIKWSGHRNGGKGHYGGANVRITLMYKGKFYKTLIASTPNDGAWVWSSIPNVGRKSADTKANFQIRVGPVKARLTRGKAAGKISDKSTKFKIKE